MRVTSIQLAMIDQPKEKNVDHALGLIDQAPTSDLLLLPEIWPCGFFSFDRYKRDSETIDGPIVLAFKAAARKRQCHILMGSMVENDGGRLYNTSILLNPAGEIAACYRKIHLFGYQSEETTLLKPGMDIVVADTPWGKSGISTCYDLRFPELYRRMTGAGATFFLVASAWPLVRMEAWRLFNRCRAHENLAFLISCNCAGANQGKTYAGHSMIVDPLGQVLAEGAEEEQFVTAEFDPNLVAAARQKFPVLEDRILS
ncbi:MAG: carbon-nitrogen family hydrolase [Desulfobacterales bacterium]|jgi:predicted amidohydrolase